MNDDSGGKPMAVAMNSRTSPTGGRAWARGSTLAFPICLQMDPLSTALSALRLAWDLYCKYESLSEARETAQNALQPLIRALEDARLGQALQQHSSSGVQGALVDVRKAADKLSERATMIAAKSTWLQVLFATKYTTDLLRLVAKLDSQVSYLRLLVGVDTNLSVQGIQAKQDQTLQQIARLEAALTQQAASTLTSAGTRQQLCVALAEARASGDTAEAATIEKLLAFLAHQPAAASREDAAGLLLQLQRQIGEAQVEKSQAEAELLQQFADYLSVKDTGAAGAGAGAGPARHASADIVPKHLQCVFCYNLYEDPVGHTHTHTHIHIHTPAHYLLHNCQPCMLPYPEQRASPSISTHRLRKRRKGTCFVVACLVLPEHRFCLSSQAAPSVASALHSGWRGTTRTHTAMWC